MKVLIIEDRAEYAELLQHHLQAISNDVKIALTMDDAMRILESVDILDLITVDLNLPGSSVDQTIKHLTDIRVRQPDAVVVVISGFLENISEDQIKFAGADGMIVKDEVIHRGQLCDRILRIARSILSAPPKFNRQLAIVEMMAQKFTQYLRDQGNPSIETHDLRASLA